MPIYEYQCDACEKTLELTQKISDPPLESCPDCGSSVRKLVSRSSFRLKGTGWYETDFKNKSGSSAPSKPPASSDSGSETKSETKSTDSGKKSTDSSKSTEAAPAKKGD